MRVRILGPLEVGRSDGLRRLQAGKCRALLATLVINAGQPMSVDRLVGELWPEGHAPRTATNQVHGYVVRLRRALGDPEGELLQTRSPGYELLLEHHDLDATRFEDLADQGSRALREGDPAGAADLLVRALELWRGPPLADVPRSDQVQAEADRLDEARLSALDNRIDADLALGRHSQVVPELGALTEAHPFRERQWAQLMLALYRCGRQADALHAYQRLYRLLDRELGVEPGIGVRDLHGQILANDPSLDLAPPAAGRPAAVPHQLPAVAGHFVGRDAELTALDAHADSSTDAVVISALIGPPGIGKTTTALHWAHRSTQRFPDGQLYVNLRGFDPSGQALDPGDAVCGFLHALGVSAERLPADLPAQSALYRTMLAGRHMLVVLDNARDADQVRPLLPGAPGCLILVTSRDRLTGLVAAEGANPIFLDLLDADHGRDLLARHLGSDRLDAEPEAVPMLVDQCARLPLALAIVAARAAVEPAMSLAALVDDLSRGGLQALDTGESATTVGAVFSWSYHALEPEAARLFRLLGLHPGPDITVLAAASTAGRGAAAARRLLAGLCRANLLGEPTPGRYTLHLLRSYARELVRAHDSDEQRGAATNRMLDHYVHTAHTAAQLLSPTRDPITLADPSAGVIPERFTDHQQATQWLIAEQRLLLGLQLQAADGRFDTHAWQLAWSLVDFLDRRGDWYDWISVQHVALTAALRLDDYQAQAQAYRGLAHANVRLGHYDQSLTHLQQALGLYEHHRDSTGQATAHCGIGYVLNRAGHHAAALSHAERALTLFRSTGQRPGQATAHNAIAWSHAQLGHYRRALTHSDQALKLLEPLGNRQGQSHTWDTKGYAHHHLDEYERAIACYQRALDLLHGLDDPRSEADTLDHLGDTYYASGNTDAARAPWRQAAAILDELGHPDADQVHAKLRELDRTENRPNP